MVLNYIWILFFLIAFLVALIKFVLYLCGFPDFGGQEVFHSIVLSTFDSGKIAVEVSLGLTGAITFWMGLMKVGEKAGVINFLSKLVGPFFSKLFPEIPKGHPALGQIMMNFSANMLGIGNAATPLGLKAMQSMQELNTEKETASNSQIMFLTLNTAGFTIIPVTIMTLRATNLAADPTDVFIPILISTYCATLVGLIAVAIRQRILDLKLFSWLFALSSVMALIVFYFSTLSPDKKGLVSGLCGYLIIFSIIVSFITAGALKKINVFETFIEGAKDGFATVIKIIPYLVAMLVGIGVFRACGAMDYIVQGIGWCFYHMGINTDFVPSLPVAFMRPLSGSGAQGLAVSAMQSNGVDSFTGRLSSIIYASADTTFYIVALYFGSVGIRKTRYAIQAGLLADLAGIVAAIFISYLFFH